MAESFTTRLIQRLQIEQKKMTTAAYTRSHRERSPIIPTELKAVH